MRRFKWKWLLVIIPVILLISVIGFVLWANNAAQPMPEALAAMQSDEAVRVETTGTLELIPLSHNSDVGFIFYPGGKVNPLAYAPMGHQLAARGYLTVIAPMPLHLAVFNINAADAVIAAHPEIKHWVIGGHSLGGSMAVRYVQGHLDKVDGLALLASYPDVDISAFVGQVVVIYGSLDGLATVAKVEGARDLLPKSTTWVRIDGGDHAQMGWYGPQAGDNAATISRADQQSQVIDALVHMLTNLKGGSGPRPSAST